MGDKPQTTPKQTIREQMVAEGKFPDLSFELWLSQLKRDAQLRGWGDDYVCDPESYRSAYDDAYRPFEILDEEAEYG